MGKLKTYRVTFWQPKHNLVFTLDAKTIAKAIEEGKTILTARGLRAYTPLAVEVFEGRGFRTINPNRWL